MENMFGPQFNGDKERKRERKGGKTERVKEREREREKVVEAGTR